MAETTLPPSREVRLQDGVLHGELEAIAFCLHTGDTGSLARSIDALELIDEKRRTQAVENAVEMILGQLTLTGHLSAMDIRKQQQEWYQRDILGIGNVVQFPVREEPEDIVA